MINLLRLYIERIFRIISKGINTIIIYKLHESNLRELLSYAGMVYERYIKK